MAEAERVAQLSEEQWNVVKAALDGEIAELHTQLIEARAEAAPLRVALGRLLNPPECVECGGPCVEHQNEIGEANGQAEFALLPGAGEGWVPPDKVVLARGALALVKKHQMETPGNPLPHWIAQEVWAGLGALKEVE